MAKKIHGTPTPLDTEVADLLRRVGALDQPLNHVISYDVRRRIDVPHVLMIEFIADEQFDAGRQAGASAEHAAFMQAEECPPVPPSA